MVHPDGFRPSSLLLDKDAPRHIWLLTRLERSRLLAIIMNLVHENVFLINTAGKHTFFDGNSHRVWVLRQNRVFISRIIRPLFMLDLISCLKIPILNVMLPLPEFGSFSYHPFVDCNLDFYYCFSFFIMSGFLGCQWLDNLRQLTVLL